jgi:hypothetical protein
MTNIQQLENELWEAADQLRANSKLTAAEYAMPVLGLIFLRHADNRFKAFLSEIDGLRLQGQGDARQAEGRRQDQVQGHQRRGQVHCHRDADGTVGGLGPARGGLARSSPRRLTTQQPSSRKQDMKQFRACGMLALLALSGAAFASSHIVDIGVPGQAGTDRSAVGATR